jgi:HSP20 family protein
MTLLRQHPLSNLIDELFYNNNATENNYIPSVNISEKENAFEMQFQVPGIKKEDINIHIEKGLLTIQHEHKTEVTTNSTNKYIRKEFSVKSFKRTFSIDDKIDADKIDANYQDGILTLVLPKKEALIAPKKLISIK